MEKRKRPPARGAQKSAAELLRELRLKENEPIDFVTTPTAPPPSEAADTPEPQAAQPASETSIPLPAARQSTHIAAGTAVEGRLRAEGNLECSGSVRGSLEADGTLLLQGVLTGDAAAQQMRLCGGRVEGNLTAQGPVEIDRDSVVEGDIKAAALTLSGRVRGDLHVQGTLRLLATAVVVGNLHCGDFCAETGAVIRGEIHMAAAEDLAACFAR
ncbi:bactofilin family protein [Feifania hominis]|uniref:Polymer-forming cytoskeletal protein n=1 Tax=Feifania hominis TaxID=2763660 RepID=A0A926HUN8_9FIRM|nr:polymer-forming cytoskeletal protein [Feifania hominis]MBC8536493.1 polymer-forming cytoskeletal protein [Feifania hominis]